MEDVTGLRVVFQRLVDAFNANDLDALVASVHEGIVQTGAFSPTAVDGKVAFKKVYQSFFSDYDNVTFTPINPHFRVNTSTGVSWGHFALSVKPKGAPMQIPVGCYTLTFTKTDQEWLVVAAHFSWLPENT
jgi:ketosteroid isomerase-like protein